MKLCEKSGAKINLGEHNTNNLGKDVNLVIYSDAVPEENSERKASVAHKIPSMSYFQFLGEYSKDKHTIAISGCHGKTHNHGSDRFDFGSG